jgi:hypothetical protein
MCNYTHAKRSPEERLSKSVHTCGSALSRFSSHTCGGIRLLGVEDQKDFTAHFIQPQASGRNALGSHMESLVLCVWGEDSSLGDHTTWAKGHSDLLRKQRCTLYKQKRLLDVQSVVFLRGSKNFFHVYS